VRQVSRKRARQLRLYKPLARDFLTGHPVCEWPPGCEARAVCVHHRRGRFGERLLDTDYWAASCAFHNEFAETHTGEALAVRVAAPHRGGGVKLCIVIPAAVAYLLTIVAANWAIHRYGIVPVGFGYVAPAGVYFVAAALVLRDLLQWSLGRKAGQAPRGRRVKPAACGSTTHASEANCLQFALGWRRHVQTVIDAPKQLGLTLEGVA
jgi:hypothetical protein